MAISTLSFTQIKSIEELENSCLVSPLLKGEWGILALDLDQTLLQGKPTLGNEHFYRFMQAQNRAKGLEADAHYSWTVQVREQIAYEACEPLWKVNQVITRFVEKGWTVVILTSRGLDMKRCTQIHLEAAKLVLKIEDVIFKGRDISGNLMSKDRCLIEWMKDQPQWKCSKSIRIRYADDLERGCAEVYRVSGHVEHASVDCFHYTGALSDPHLTRDQLEQLMVQLHAYREGFEIPYNHMQPDVECAMSELGITEIDPVMVHEAIRKVAAFQGFPF